jgi:hypothetical protein
VLLCAYSVPEAWGSDAGKFHRRIFLWNSPTAGPRELIVSGGSGAAETEDVFRVAGLMEVVEQEKARFFDHNHPPFTSVDLEYSPDVDVSGPQKSVIVNPQVWGYDVIQHPSSLQGARRDEG